MNRVCALQQMGTGRFKEVLSDHRGSLSVEIHIRKQSTSFDVRYQGASLSGMAQNSALVSGRYARMLPFSSLPASGREVACERHDRGRE
jgi:hypothetical protein